MTKTLPERAHETAHNIQSIIDYMRSTGPGQWQLDVVRSKDGTKNCFFGHLFNYGIQVAKSSGYEDRAEEYATRLWEAFEEQWSTTFYIYLINDGKNPDYPQLTARERVIAYLENLRDGKELTTMESMEQYFQLSEEK